MFMFVTMTTKPLWQDPMPSSCYRCTIEPAMWQVHVKFPKPNRLDRNFHGSSSMAFLECLIPPMEDFLLQPRLWRPMDLAQKDHVESPLPEVWPNMEGCLCHPRSYLRTRWVGQRPRCSGILAIHCHRCTTYRPWQPAVCVKQAPAKKIFKAAQRTQRFEAIFCQNSHPGKICIQPATSHMSIFQSIAAWIQVFEFKNPLEIT